jgi:hypothetical protein
MIKAVTHTNKARKNGTCGDKQRKKKKERKQRKTLSWAYRGHSAWWDAAKITATHLVLGVHPLWAVNSDQVEAQSDGQSQNRQDQSNAGMRRLSEFYEVL